MEPVEAFIGVVSILGIVAVFYWIVRRSKNEAAEKP
jgi:hypothetical protein